MLTEGFSDRTVEMREDSLASFFLAGDQSNGLNGGHGRGNDKGFECGRQQGGASVWNDMRDYSTGLLTDCCGHEARDFKVCNASYT